MEHIATKNTQQRPDLVVAVPSWLLSKYLNETQASHSFYCFPFLNNGISGVIQSEKVRYKLIIYGLVMLNSTNEPLKGKV